jgi:hypothetical protein
MLSPRAFGARFPYGPGAVETPGISFGYTPRREGLQLAAGRKKALPGEPGRALNTLVS